MKRAIVTGATGQIGSELVRALRSQYGGENILATGHKKKHSSEISSSGPTAYFDTQDYDTFAATVSDFKPDTIFHLAALLSATGEEHPQLAWQINMNGLNNALEAARHNNCALFFPSSIGAFGPSTPPDNTPQITIQRPNTIYGITKLSGELLCDYYFKRYGVDSRGLRFPGLISYLTPPGGGTTDYAVEIFYAALEKKCYECFLKEDTRLDMMYMPDAIRAIIEVMEAPAEKLQNRNAYNLAATAFTPAEISAAIRKELPDFTISYKVDPVRQAIADSWPHHMDDSAARLEWGWKHEYDLERIVKEMLQHISRSEV